MPARYSRRAKLPAAPSQGVFSKLPMYAWGRTQSCFRRFTLSRRTRERGKSGSHVLEREAQWPSARIRVCLPWRTAAAVRLHRLCDPRRSMTWLWSLHTVECSFSTLTGSRVRVRSRACCRRIDVGVGPFCTRQLPHAGKRAHRAAFT